MDSIFYHYTDFQALDGILHSAQLRVNNVLRMNDSAEMRHFMGRLFGGDRPGPAREEGQPRQGASALRPGKRDPTYRSGRQRKGDRRRGAGHGASVYHEA